MVQAFQDNVVRYANQPIGVVVAETFEQAEEAAHLVRVEYAVEPHHLDLDGRVAEGYSPPKAAEAASHPSAIAAM